MTFETRLLDELRTVVEERSRPHWGRRITAVAAGIAALSTALAMGLGGAGPGPTASANAVEVQPDGSVEVTWQDTQERAELQRALTDAGVPARVVVMMPGCTTEGVAADDQSAVGDLSIPTVGLSLVVRPERIPPGSFLLVSIRLPEDFPPRDDAVPVRFVGIARAIVTAVPACARPV